MNDTEGASSLKSPLMADNKARATIANDNMSNLVSEQMEAQQANKVKTETEASMPFHASSIYARAAARDSLTLILAAFASVFVSLWLAPAWNGIDAAACISAGYVLCLFCFQNMFGLEWVDWDRPIMPLLMASIGTFLLPSILFAQGLWFGSWRAASLLADAALVLAAYRVLIRGAFFPMPKPGSLKDRVCIITGCNAGIGYETAEVLARGGATIVFACRSESKALAAMQRLLDSSEDAGVRKGQLRFLQLDVSSLASVRRFVDSVKSAKLKVNTLILNAGVMLSSRQLSEDGIEMTMASNHLGHFLLARLLLPQLLEAETRGEAPRLVLVGSSLCYLHDAFDFEEVIAVKSDAERQRFMARPYSIWRAYGQSKIANLLFTVELDRRLRSRGSRMTVNCIHPGEVLTDISRDMNPVLLWFYFVLRPLCYTLFKTPLQGCACTVFAATAPQFAKADAGCSGLYLSRFAPATKSAVVQNEAVAKRLWDLSEKLTGSVPPL